MGVSNAHKLRMGSAWAKAAPRTTGATTLHIRRVISSFALSCSGERLCNHDENAAAFADKSQSDSGQMRRRKRETKALEMRGSKLPGKLAITRNVSVCSLKSADMEMMLERVVLSMGAGDASM